LEKPDRRFQKALGLDVSVWIETLERKEVQNQRPSQRLLPP
jgi:hypothetical protein